MRFGKKLFYISEIIILFIFLWMTGFLTGKNLFLNSVNPVVYGKKGIISVSGWLNRISDGMVGGLVPLWLIEKEKTAFINSDSCEIYPSDGVLDAIYAENHPEAASMDDDLVKDVIGPVSDGQGIVYTADMLQDYNYFVSQFYAVDSTTYADGLLDAETFFDMDLTIDLNGEEPKVLIYHTHSQEAFADSRSGRWEDTVVGLGEILKDNLQERYGISTIHLTDTFDIIDGVIDRSSAYTYAEERVREVLEEYPSIKVIIDLHRDGVSDETRLVTNINGKDTAQLMFLNGLCRTVSSGPIAYLQNEYLTENLAFSFKLQLKAAEYYPDLMRRIYLRSYQYNLHIRPRSLLVECGAQTNTVEEVQNAMPLLADMLYLVLSGN
ncbi:MAG: stage II sporulation protein P [Frisingicoccus sp.]|uniref:stage II sporulation protein P n=1 Tax=Frisingicoccus sp. TaxID=1918627 RepID=UPI00260C4EDF|nr:stage II sporulation protein P [Frisingicoccus sp.]MDD6231962.1 stage II sporulation protein P [Frisingicoccus sp.]